ncbi:hypothetical protein C8Q80DRAFT_1341428 [Daedaleopsis nitida]|nr:hypothetical protein C8Q80DRAFT_1341428 [Daedaleopsis nitida]
MSAHGTAPNPRSGRSNAQMHAHGQGGSPRTLILGTAAVAAGLGAFWLLQFKVQNRSHNSNNPAEMPTWQYRHASQAPEFNARMSSPGGTETAVRNRNEPTQYKTAMPVDSKHAPGGGGAASSGMVQAHAHGDGGRGLESGAASERGGESDPRGKDNHVMRKGEDGSNDKAVLSSIMTALHGDPKKTTQDADGHVGQPAPTRRMNDRGGFYTKNSDYKDGFRRD